MPIPKITTKAIMDFGAMVCKPQNPTCDICPLVSGCLAKAKHRIPLLPVKEKKIKIKHRYLNFIVLTTGTETVLEKRTGNGIWKNLYQFPLIEAHNLVDKATLIKDIFFKEQKNTNPNIRLFNTTPWIHKLTHQHLHTQFWILKVSNIKSPNTVFWKDVNDFAVPKLIHKFLEMYTAK